MRPFRFETIRPSTCWHGPSFASSAVGRPVSGRSTASEPARPVVRYRLPVRDDPAGARLARPVVRFRIPGRDDPAAARFARPVVRFVLGSGRFDRGPAPVGPSFASGPGAGSVRPVPPALPRRGRERAGLGKPARIAGGADDRRGDGPGAGPGSLGHGSELPRGWGVSKRDGGPGSLGSGRCGVLARGAGSRSGGPVGRSATESSVHICHFVSSVHICHGTIFSNRDAGSKSRNETPDGLAKAGAGFGR